MPITPVVNGAVITTADIAAMHATARSAINSIQNSDLGRFTFNHLQLDSILAAAEWTNTKTSATVDISKDIAYTDITSADLVTANMTRVVNWSVNQALPACYVLIFVNFDITGWTTRVGTDWARHTAVFGLGVSVNSGAQAFPNGLTDRGICRARTAGLDDEFSPGVDPGAGADMSQEAHQPCSMMSVYDGTAGSFTLSNISLWAAACLSGSSNPLENGVGSGRYRIPRATVSYIALRPT